jgi:hypothetical protein
MCFVKLRSTMRPARGVGWAVRMFGGKWFTGTGETGYPPFRTRFYTVPFVTIGRSGYGGCRGEGTRQG